MVKKSSLVDAVTRAARNESGQIGVIILLLMVVLLTIGLSVATRSTQDLFLSQQQVESTRVFNAAEAGVEEALSTQLGFSGDSTSGQISNFAGTDVDVDYTINKVNYFEMRMFEMSTARIDLAGSSAGNQIVIDWSRNDDCSGQLPALAVSVYNETAGVTSVRHYGYAACSGDDNFTVGSTINDGGYRRRVTLTLQSGDIFARIKPLYDDTYLRVTAVPGWTMPTQYYNIRSEAQNTIGNEVRIVEVNRTLEAAPSLFDFVVFSGDTIDK